MKYSQETIKTLLEAELINDHNLNKLVGGFYIENPAVALKKRIDAGEFENAAPEELEREKNAALKSAERFDDMPEMNILSAYLLNDTIPVESRVQFVEDLIATRLKFEGVAEVSEEKKETPKFYELELTEEFDLMH